MNRIGLPVFSAILSIGSLSAAAPLPPEPDKGFVTELHKQKAGKIVFASTADAVTTPEKPAALRDAFSSADKIFFRAYLPRSLNNAFRAEGVDCQEPFRIWSIQVDGNVVPRGENDPYFYWEPIDLNGFRQSTSIRFDEPLNGKPTDEKAIWRSYAELVAPKLAAGEHTVTLSVSAKCSSKNTKPLDAYLKEPLATGTFKLTVASGAQADVMPKPAKKDPKLEREAVGAIEAQWHGDKVEKLVLTDKDWNVETVKLKGVAVPQRRRMGAQVAVKQPGGKCRIFNVTLIQEATGKNSFGKTEIATGDSRELVCEALK